MYASGVHARPVLLLTILLAACGGDDDATPAMDAGHPDAGHDAGPVIVDAGRDATAPVDAALDAPPSMIPYDVDGPVPYTMEVQHVTDDGGDTFDVTVWMPSTPGPHPAVSFSCGSTQTAAGYVPYGQRLASYGIAMFLADDPGVFTNTGDIVPHAEYVVHTWIPATYPQIDTTKIGLGGHSRGGAVSLLTAEHLRGEVVAWAGLDPVDNEFLMAPREYARTNLSMIGIPTVFLGAEVESNCAPAADSWPTLFPLAPDPTVLLLGLGAGHVQYELPSACTGCGACSPNGTVPDDVVLAYAVRYFTAFFARELLGDTTVGAMFEGAGAPEDVAAGLIEVR